MPLPEPLISVVIPAFNCAAYIGRALDSICRQADGNLEVIVVDDGSTDSTDAALAEYSEHIRVIRQPNQGVAAARNRAISVARGSWIAFLDADDAWRVNRLQLGRMVLSNCPNAALIFSSFSLVDELSTCLVADAVKSYYGVFDRHGLQWTDILRLVREGPATAASATYEGNCFETLYLGNFIKTSTVLVRRSVIQQLGGFDRNLVTEEDYDLWLRIAMNHDVAYIDTPLVDVRRRPEQLTSAENALMVASNSVRVVAQTTERASFRLEPDRVRLRLAEVNRRLANVALVAGQQAHARKAALASLHYGGLHPAVLAMLACSIVPGRVTIGFGKAWRAVRSYLN